MNVIAASSEETNSASTLASTANDELKNLYDDYYPFVVDFLTKNNAFERQISFPLLIKPLPEYFDAKVKLMIVGQETQKWAFSDKIPFLRAGIQNQAVVESLLKLYLNVRLDEKRNSPFWVFSRKLNSRFNKSNKAYVWNNLNKIDEKGTSPKWDIFHGLCSTSSNNIINREFQILNPHVVVFTTGDKLDGHLRSVFKGITITPLNDYISILEHEYLPKHSYKTEHPLTLRLRGSFMM